MIFGVSRPIRNKEFVCREFGVGLRLGLDRVSARASVRARAFGLEMEKMIGLRRGVGKYLLTIMQS